VTTQANRFTLLDTETEGEAGLHREILALRERVFALESVTIGLVELLAEHGIEAEAETEAEAEL
jgi:hypothetical protein